MTNELLYIITFLVACLFSGALTPVFRKVAIKLNILDKPITEVKTHKVATPYLGGIAIWLGWAISLIVIRYITHFPTGTLNNIRSLMAGSFLLLLLGLCDDIKKGGLGFKIKFLIQAVACVIVTVFFDIRIHFIENYFLSVAVSMLWLVGVSNAFNLIDIMDGLSCGIAAIAACFFVVISLPSEMIYVNFCAVALAGACIGFIPYNLSKKRKIFMGDTGSLAIGFILACLAMGTEYTKINHVAVFAPLLILSVPIYETIFVSIIRMTKGKNPFLGSKDHFPLRLEKAGCSRKQVLLIAYSACVIFGIAAYFAVIASQTVAVIICAVSVVALLFVSFKLSKIKMD